MLRCGKVLRALHEFLHTTWKALDEIGRGSGSAPFTQAQLCWFDLFLLEGNKDFKVLPSGSFQESLRPGLLKLQKGFERNSDSE